MKRNRRRSIRVPLADRSTPPSLAAILREIAVKAAP
jgi:hypothetical protein